MASKNKKTTVKKPVKIKTAKAATVKTGQKSTPKPVKKVKPVSHASAKAVKVAPKTPVSSKAKPAAKKGRLDVKKMEQIRDMLIKLRERLTGQITALSDDSLKYVDDSSSEDRTDDFDREFALNLVSSEQDSVFEIDSALRRIKDGVYGSCDSCGCPIEKARLQALPFARMCVQCQSASEKGRARFRPFGEALEQGVEQEAPEVAEPEENE